MICYLHAVKVIKITIFSKQKEIKIRLKKNNQNSIHCKTQLFQIEAYTHTHV